MSASSRAPLAEKAPLRYRPFLLERWFATREFSAPHVLCASDCETMTVGELVALAPGAADALAALRLGYTESTGHPALRRAVARQYDSIGPDDVLIHAGAEEAIFTLIHAALAPGDHALVHAPSYQSLSEIARGIGCDVTLLETRHEDGWALDPDDVAARIRPRTRLLVINTPHNPTGAQLSRDCFEALVALAHRHGLVLLSDEVYRGLEVDEGDRLPPACDRYERAVSLGVMSKSYGLAGLRIGWVATRARDLLARTAAVKDYTTICSAGPSELLATTALGAAQRIVARNRAIVRQNLEQADAFLARQAGRLEWVRPRAGSVAFPRFVEPVDVEAFCTAALERAGVLLLPGTVFEPGSRAFRLGLGRRGFTEGLARLEDFLAQGG